MFVKIHLCYDDGVKRATIHTAPALLGNMLSDAERGRLVVHLWPHDFPASAKGPDCPVAPLASLWCPEVSVFLQGEFAVTGLERRQAGRRARWVAQRWHCEPTTFADIAEELARTDSRFGEITPYTAAR